MRRRLVVGSVAINVVFLVLLVWPAAGVNSWSAVRGGSGAPGTRNAPASANSTSATRRSGYQSRPGSVWSQLESDDFREFANHLRAVGCPEETICDILRPEIERAFASRQRRLEQDGNFWATGPARRALRTRTELAKLALSEEQDHLLTELTCPSNLIDKDRDITTVGMVNVVTGFLNPATQRKLIQLISEFEQIEQRWRQKTGAILLPEDVEALETERAALQQRLYGLLTEHERQEIDLRISSFANRQFGVDDERLKSLNLTPGELREFVRIASATEVSPLAKMLSLSSLLEEPPPLMTEAESKTHLQTLLGEERYAEYRRQQDDAYRGAEQLLTEHKLAPEIPVEVYQAMEQFRADLAPIREAWKTDRATALQSLLEQREEIRTRLDAVLAGVPQKDRQDLLNRWVDQAIQQFWRAP
jgi:hypothetical protein